MHETHAPSRPRVGPRVGAPSAPRRPRTPRAAARSLGRVGLLLDAGFFFKALGDPTRLTLLACLMRCGRDCTVGEIGQCCSVDLSVVSRHLRLLERSGAVSARKRGREVYYAARCEHLAGVLRSMASAIESCGAACACVPGPTGGRCDQR